MKKLSLFIILLCFVLTNALFSQLAFQNGSMEAPDDSVKYNLWVDGYLNGNLPGWWAEPGVLDSGREIIQGLGEVPDGKYCAYAYNLDETVWNLAGTVEAGKLDLTVTFYCSYSWAQDLLDQYSVIIKFATFEGTDTAGYELIDMLDQPFPSDKINDAKEWLDYEFNTILPVSTVGKKLLIGFDIASAGSQLAWFNFDLFELEVKSVTGISEISENTLMIYPNPSTGMFRLNLLSDETEYQIYDMSGRQLSKGTMLGRNATLNLSDYNAGIYLLRTNSDKAERFDKLIVK